MLIGLKVVGIPPLIFLYILLNIQINSYCFFLSSHHFFHSFPYSHPLLLGPSPRLPLQCLTPLPNQQPNGQISHPPTIPSPSWPPTTGEAKWPTSADHFADERERERERERESSIYNMMQCLVWLTIIVDFFRILNSNE